MTLTYALITPAKDEAENLARLAESLSAQTIAPSVWIVVDNGSVDETPDLIEDLRRRHEWVTAVQTEGGATAPGPPVVRAFNSGLRRLRSNADVVVKLDADVSFGPDYFERLLDEFEADPTLGIASGVCLELEDGVWTEKYVTGDHVRGATRAYRTACLDEIGPLPESVGWDGVDELKASVLGWRTASIQGLPFYHHRRVGERDGGATRRWVAEGRCAHYMGYGLTYLVVRTFGRALRDRDRAAFAMLWGYGTSALHSEPRYPDEAVRSYLREQQSIRRLPQRFRESLGRRAA
jgi:glycosyltransferase involved in cell wall biosynthesis